MKNTIRKILEFLVSLWKQYICRHRRFWILLLIVACLPFLFTRAALWFGFTESSGFIGDTIGGTTAPAIGLISIYLLYKTLRSQIDFNNEQLKYNKEQQEYNKEQKKLAFDEQFKSTLFNMLETQRELRNRVSMSLKGGEESTSLFSTTINDLSGIYEVLNYEKYCSEEDEGHGHTLYRRSRRFNITREFYDYYHNFKQEYQKVALGIAIYYDKHEDLGMYFRYLYYVLKFIDEARTEEIQTFYRGEELDKVRAKYEEYILFLQTQLTVDELLLLFYNSFIIIGLQDLLIKYKFLALLDVDHLLVPSHNCVPKIMLNSNKHMYAQIVKKPQGYIFSGFGVVNKN